MLASGWLISETMGRYFHSKKQFFLLLFHYLELIIFIKTMHTEKDILKQIESGKYKDCYVIYNRRSTDDADNQKNSLVYQKNKNLEYARKERLKIADITIIGLMTEGIISEKHSAFKENEIMEVLDDGTVRIKIDRPKFHKLVQYLNKKLFKGVIFLCYDRASRNPADDAVINKLKKGKIDLQFSMADYDENATGDMHMDMDSAFARHHSRLTSEKVTEVAKENRAEGKCTYGAPVGYINEGNMDWKPKDPIRAPIIIRMFEMANENWSTRDICKWAIEQGFTMPARRPKRTLAEKLQDEGDDDDKRTKIEALPRHTTISQILKNNFYIGLIIGNDGDFIKSTSHEPLVDEALFYAVQAKLSKKNKSKQYDKPLDYPYRKLFRCGSCPRGYTPYPKKGHLFLGSRCDAGCTNTNKSISETAFKELVDPLIKKLVYTNEELAQLEKNADIDIRRIEKSRVREIESIENKKKKIRNDLEYLRSEKTTLLRTGAYTPEEYMSEVSKNERGLDELTNKEIISEQAMREALKDVIKVSELLKNLTLYWDFADEYKKDEILRTIFSELIITEKTLTFELNPDFQWLNNRLKFSCAQERT